MSHRVEKRYCPNCHYPLPDYGEFCSNCSQKFTDGKVPVKVLVLDFLDSVLNIDSRIFRTIGALFIPGKLTREYFKGRQKRYLSPARLFFVLTIIHIAVLGYLTLETLEDGLGKFSESQQRDGQQAAFMDRLDTAKLEIEKLFPNQPVVVQSLDSLTKHLNDTRGDSLNFGYLKFDQDAGSIKTQSIKISIKDMYALSVNELVERYKVEGVFSNIQVRQILKVYTKGGNLPQFVLGNLVWMIVLMMPALGLILKLLYIRRKRYFVEHLVFSFHYHAFAFLIVSAALILYALAEEAWIPQIISPDWLFPIIFLSVMIYLFVAMRRVYGQGITKTFLKYTFLNFSYLFIFILFLSFTFAISALTF